MADVSVEFGATDVGLEKALQQIQTEMGNLQGKVKSGELSMEELESTMKRIGQVENMEKRLKAMGDASAESSPKIKKLGDDIDTAGSSAQSVGGIFDAEFKKIAGAFTVGNLAAQGFQKIIDLAFSAAQAVVQGFSDALDLGGRLTDLSSRTGETAGKLLVLETAFKNSGLEASTVGTAINKLQNFMQDAANGGDKQRAAMQSLGVSMSELAGKTPTQQMQVFADKIAGIEDPTARAAAASEVFGDKLGGKLLPLFSDFSGNLDDARTKVGSLEQVMDENAATFDAAAETIEAVKGKMAAFAAGVLSQTIPAVDDLGESMEQVDAAKLGQDIGTILTPAVEELAGFINDLLTEYAEYAKATNAAAAGDYDLANSSKEVTGAFDLLKTMVNSVVGPLSDLISGTDSYTSAANKAAEEAKNASNEIKGTGTAAQTAATGLENVGTASDTATGKVDKLGTSAQATGQNIAGAFSLTSDFVPELDKVSASWGGVNDQILGGKNLLTDNYNLADSMTAKIDEQVDGFGGVNDQLTTSKDLSKLIEDTYGKHADKLAEIQAKQDALAAKETERKNKIREALDLEFQIADAKARGDAELVKTLENQKLFTAELQKAIDAGMGEPQARAFAQQMVNAKNAASSIADRNVTIGVVTKVNSAAYDQLMASLQAGSATPQQIEVITKVTGTSDLNQAYKTLQDMQAINKNLDVALKVTGAGSLDELKKDLQGIATPHLANLALQITGKKDFDDAMRDLPSFAGTRTADLILQAHGFQSMQGFINQLNGIPDEKRTKLICETLGVADVNAAKHAIDRVLADNGKKSTISVGADTSEVDQKLQTVRQSTSMPLAFQTTADISAATASIDNLKQTALQPLTLNLQGDASDVAAKVAAFNGNPIQFSLNGNSAPITNTIDALSSAPLSLSLHGDTTAVQSQIQTITGSPKNLDLNADQSIKQIQSDLKKEVDVSLQSSDGTKILGEIKTFVREIKTLVGKIEPKLPTAALAA